MSKVTDAVMTPEALIQWMTDSAYSIDSLATALQCNRVTIHKWRAGIHAISHVTVLALERLAEDKRALAARKRVRPRIVSR